MRVRDVLLVFCFMLILLLQRDNFGVWHMGFLKSSYALADSEIEWDATTLQRLSTPGSAAFYPRMISLKDGSLLLAYASNGNVVITKSSNAGKNWTKPIVVAAQQDGVNQDTPELLQLQNGAVLICYGSRPQGALRGAPEAGKHFDIRVQLSYDNGAAWGFEKVLYMADTSFKNGCWEPAAVQLPSGEIQLFFANEGIYKNSDEQNISMLRSVDGGRTWSASPQLISFRKGGRDGMPVPLWLAKQQTLLVAIEDPGIKNFKPYIIRSACKGGWKRLIDSDDKNREYALATKLADSIYAGAPYLRQLASGETILSYQSTEGRKKNSLNNAVMVVAIGDSNGKKFTAKSVPFAVAEGYSALWNSLCITGDTIIALTATNAFSRSRSEVWMIKGHLKRS